MLVLTPANCYDGLVLKFDERSIMARRKAKYGAAIKRRLKRKTRMRENRMAVLGTARSQASKREPTAPSKPKRAAYVPVDLGDPSLYFE